MSYRGWKYRCYADEPETPRVDFICGFLGGMAGFFNFPGWLLIYFGWLDIGATLLLCAVVGLLFGGWIIYEAGKEKSLSERIAHEPETICKE